MDKERATKLLILKRVYKKQLEREMKENNMMGITFIIAKCMDDLFNDIGQIL